MVTLHHGDCLEFMRGMADNSVDLIATDPPYFKMKGEWWDRQWDNAAGFIAWIGQLCEQWQRILKPNGSLYVFASPRMAARVEVAIAERFNVLNSITWAKPEPTSEINYGAGNGGRVSKESLRTYYPNTERIIFADHFNSDNIAKGEAGYVAKCDQLRGFIFEPLRKYLDDERKRAGINFEQVRQIVGCAAGSGLPSHWFTSSQWALPTKRHYELLREGFSRLDHGGAYLTREYEDLRREYEDLRREYEDLRREYEDLRRPFSVSADVPYTDVWTFKTVSTYAGKHPCEKPLDMMRHIVRTSTKAGAVVLDCFMGSGSTIEAAQELGRDAIGIDIEQKWIDFTQRRLERAQVKQPALIQEK